MPPTPPRPLRATLRHLLEGAARVAVVGVGSELRGDDAAGMLVVQGLCEALAGMPGAEGVLLLEGSTAPENVTGDIRAFGPTHVVLVDAAAMGRRPGDIGEIDPDTIEGISFSTHALPVALMCRYLEEDLGMKVVILGIEPLSMGFDAPVSPEVREGVSHLVAALADVLGG